MISSLATSQNWGKENPGCPTMVFTNCSKGSGYGKSIATEVLVDSILIS
jgi:hypothetical protein